MVNDAQRDQLIKILSSGEPISSEWSRILFPPERREYELVYYGKEREEDIIGDTLAVPLQPVRTFGSCNSNEWQNMLIFGDNLQAMKTLLEEKKAGRLRNEDGSSGIRLIYIDPPFATKRDFKGNQEQKAYQDKVVGSQFLEFLRKRLIFMRELLSDDGSIFVHLDWKKCHYVRVLLDEIFGENRFVNEIIWYYTNKYGANSNALDSFHNTIYRYSKGKKLVYEPIKIPVKVERQQPLRKWNKSLNKNEWLKDSDGNYLYAESKEKDAGDVWEIPVINPMAKERLGYPTQKPEQLLEWIISSSSGKGDLILDVFAGSGTTCAVAEKLGRRWIGIDCGKLSIYTMQKRLLNLRSEIGNKGKELEAKPFVLMNAGLYDFSKLRELPWDSWRFFALQLFQCRDERHKIGGVELDGYFKGASVLVFNHMKEKNVRMHEALGTKIGRRMFIIAPSLTFDFQQDYIDVGVVRYYALRIPYSIINELHKRQFTALVQPADEVGVNDTVEAVGFDFIRPPEVTFTSESNDEEFVIVRISSFRCEAAVRDLDKKNDFESLSMVMVDYDYDDKVFDLAHIFYAEDLRKKDWGMQIPQSIVGEKMMLVFIDIYGNESRVVVTRQSLGLVETRKSKALASSSSSAKKKSLKSRKSSKSSVLSKTKATTVKTKTSSESLPSSKSKVSRKKKTSSKASALSKTKTGAKAKTSAELKESKKKSSFRRGVKKSSK
jgi:site-specific DNA-methyltransferase (adenine-specific)/adenine-specific DNA-methyltransferase